MSEKKTKFKYFTIFDYEEEQEYLRQEHKHGWKLSKVTFPGFYTFEKCTPEDVVYQLDYNQDKEKEKEEYIQMFKDCGWEYMFDFVGYSYLRKPVSEMIGEEEIFNDDSSKKDMVERVYKGRMVPLLVIFFAIIIPQLIAQMNHPSGIGSAVFVVYVFMFIIYVGIFVKCATMYRRLKRK